MATRDEYGYVLKIVTHSPFHPWARITAQLAQALNGYKDEPGIVSTVGVYTPKFGMGSLENPKMVGGGEVDAGITNPGVTAKMAMEGKGPFSKSVGELRAIARFPEPDYIFWLVGEELGIRTMGEIPRKRPPMALVSGRIGPTGPDTLTWTVEEVMKQYGFTYKDVESWGGKVLFPGPSTVGVPILKKGGANAIFQEGVHHVMWDDLTNARPLRSLALRRDVVDYMARTYGFEEAVIPKGRLRGIEEDQLTVDFGGWLLFCREDLPEELAYLLAKASMEQRERIGEPYKDMPPHIRSLEYPITPQHLCTSCVLPLHRGAETFYREFGCL